MKNTIIFATLLSVLLYSCSQDDVVAPSAEFNIQAFDKIKNEFYNLDKPYELKVNTEYQVISENDGEYNSFYKGDSTKINGKWVYYIYSPEAKSNHRGDALSYVIELNKSIVKLKYPTVGSYKVTFVAAAVGDEGNTVKFTVNDKETITVIP